MWAEIICYIHHGVDIVVLTCSDRAYIIVVHCEDLS